MHTLYVPAVLRVPTLKLMDVTVIVQGTYSNPTIPVVKVPGIAAPNTPVVADKGFGTTVLVGYGVVKELEMKAVLTFAVLKVVTLVELKFPLLSTETALEEPAHTWKISDDVEDVL